MQRVVKVFGQDRVQIKLGTVVMVQRLSHVMIWNLVQVLIRSRFFKYRAFFKEWLDI